MTKFSPKQIPQVINFLKLFKEDYNRKVIAIFPRDKTKFISHWHFFTDDVDFYFSEDRKIADAVIDESIDFKIIFCYLPNFGKLDNEKGAIKIKIDLDETNKNN